MRAPEFWERDGGKVAPLLLYPISRLYVAIVRRRFRTASPWRAPVPVICIGNLIAGGAGKTPVAISVAERLIAQGRRPHFLTRGYGGREAGPLRVDPAHHTARDVGDEALLLASIAPTWVSRDRVAGAKGAVEAGAEMIVMDDGYQNPSLHKDVSLVVVDGEYGFGNGYCIPSGPLREPLANGLERASAIVLMGKDESGVRERVPPELPVLAAHMAPGPEASELSDKPVLAFAGIGRPGKFFDTLKALGCRVVAAHPYADHYPYDREEIEALAEEARALEAIPVTTAKDFARIPPDARGLVKVLSIRVEWDDAAALDRLIAAAPVPVTTG